MTEPPTLTGPCEAGLAASPWTTPAQTEF